MEGLYSLTTKTAESQFIDKVRQGNVSEVRTALKEQPSLLDARDIRSPNRSALHIAACESHEDMVRLLLRRGANPWIGDCNGVTPLLEVKLGSAENPEVDREKLSRRLCTALRKQPPTITTQVKRKSKPTEQAPPIISIDLVCVDDVPPPMVPGKLSETDQARADVQKLWTWHLDVGFPALQRDRKRLVWLDARALTAEVADAGAAPATERGKVQEEVTRREGILRTLESTALEDGTLTIGQVVHRVLEDAEGLAPLSEAKALGSVSLRSLLAAEVRAEAVVTDYLEMLADPGAKLHCRCAKVRRELVPRIEEWLQATLDRRRLYAKAYSIDLDQYSQSTRAALRRAQRLVDGQQDDDTDRRSSTGAISNSSDLSNEKIAEAAKSPPPSATVSASPPTVQPPHNHRSVSPLLSRSDSDGTSRGSVSPLTSGGSDVDLASHRSVSSASSDPDTSGRSPRPALRTTELSGGADASPSPPQRRGGGGGRRRRRQTGGATKHHPLRRFGTDEAVDDRTTVATENARLRLLRRVASEGSVSEAGGASDGSRESAGPLSPDSLRRSPSKLSARSDVDTVSHTSASSLRGRLADVAAAAAAGGGSEADPRGGSTLGLVGAATCPPQYGLRRRTSTESIELVDSPDEAVGDRVRWRRPTKLPGNIGTASGVVSSQSEPGRRGRKGRRRGVPRPDETGPNDVRDDGAEVVDPLQGTPKRRRSPGRRRRHRPLPSITSE